MGDSNDAFMEDFGDSLLNDEEGDPYQTKSSRNAAEALDTSLQAPNANDFSNARLIEEVSVRAKLRLLCKAQVYSIQKTHMDSLQRAVDLCCRFLLVSYYFV